MGKEEHPTRLIEPDVKMRRLIRLPSIQGQTFRNETRAPPKQLWGMQGRDKRVDLGEDRIRASLDASNCLISATLSERGQSLTDAQKQ